MLIQPSARPLSPFGRLRGKFCWLRATLISSIGLIQCSTLVCGSSLQQETGTVPGVGALPAEELRFEHAVLAADAQRRRRELVCTGPIGQQVVDVPEAGGDETDFLGGGDGQRGRQP